MLMKFFRRGWHGGQLRTAALGWHRVSSVRATGVTGSERDPMAQLIWRQPMADRPEHRRRIHRDIEAAETSDGRIELWADGPALHHPGPPGRDRSGRDRGPQAAGPRAGSRRRYRRSVTTGSRRGRRASCRGSRRGGCAQRRATKRRRLINRLDLARAMARAARPSRPVSPPPAPPRYGEVTKARSDCLRRPPWYPANPRVECNGGRPATAEFEVVAGPSVDSQQRIAADALRVHPARRHAQSARRRAWH